MTLVSRQYLCSGASRGTHRILAPNVSVRRAGAMRRRCAAENLSSMLLHTYHLRAWLRGFTVLPRVTGGLGGLGDVRGPFDAEYASRRLPNMRQWLRGNTYQHSNK